MVCYGIFWSGQFVAETDILAYIQCSLPRQRQKSQLYTCYVDLVGKCVKMECGSDFGCKIGDHCVGGFCKPQKDFCKTDGDCSKDQCCVIKGNGERGGVCKSLRKPGNWCPLKVRNSLLFLIPDTRQYC